MQEGRWTDVKIDRGLMAGSGTMLVLSLLSERDMYGYQIIEEMALRSSHVFELKEGTLYPILHGLEKEKYLTSFRQETPGGRERRYYHLTARGRQFLDEKRQEWETFRQGVHDVLYGGANALAWAMG